MTDRQRELVQAVWAYVGPLPDVAVELFYAELFRRDPTLRAFVADRLPAQKRLLFPAIDILVRGLDDPSALRAAARQLGRRHAAGGVEYARPGTVRGALLHVMRETAGPLFTPEAEDAWIAFHDFLAGAYVDEDPAPACHLHPRPAAAPGAAALA